MTRPNARIVTACLAALLAAAAARADSNSWKGDFLARVRFAPGVSAADAGMVRGLLADALDTPTGAERARRFAADGGGVITNPHYAA